MSITPFKARLVSGAFATLAVGIGVNILFLQPDDPNRSARRLVNAGDAETASLHLSETPVRQVNRRQRYASRGGTLSRDDINIDNPVPLNEWNNTDEEAATRALDQIDSQNADLVDNLPTPKLIRTIQAELTRRGYTPGPIDGVTGVMTQAAIMAYEHDNGLPITAAATRNLLKRLLLGPTQRGLRANHRRPKVSRATAARITRGVQTTLADLGYAPGPAHGRLGRELKAAIREFETDRQLVATGRVSGKLIAALNKATGVSFSRVLR